MSVRRKSLRVAFAILIIAIVGLVSNAITQPGIERQFLASSNESLVFAARLWKIPSASVRRLPSATLKMRTEQSDEGRRVRFMMPPSSPLPWVYTTTEHVAPFVMRVHYGWAVGGTGMSFGQGSDRLVITFFGLHFPMRERPVWYF